MACRALKLNRRCQRKSSAHHCSNTPARQPQATGQQQEQAFATTHFTRAEYRRGVYVVKRGGSAITQRNAGGKKISCVNDGIRL
jgi:hypothetical protein